MSIFTKCAARAGVVMVMTAAIGSAHALTITLDTTLLDANSTLTLSQDALNALSLVNSTVTAGGYATSLGSTSGGLPQYNIPITSLSTSVSLFPFSVMLPAAASAKGSSLTFTDKKNGEAVSFSNLTINFNNDIIYGDFASSASTSRQMDLFKFSVTKPLQFNFSGGISLSESLGNMYMTSDAVNAFQRGLSLPKAASLVLPSINFGSIDAKIVPWFRSPPLGTVPEPSTYVFGGVGFVLLGLIRRRMSWSWPVHSISSKGST